MVRHASGTLLRLQTGPRSEVHDLQEAEGRGHERRFFGDVRCSTDEQDLGALRAALEGLGVTSERICTDHDLSGTNRARPGLDQALTAVRAGDTLVIPKLGWLARSVPGARSIAGELLRHGARRQLGPSVHDPMGRVFFVTLATFAGCEADLIRMRPCAAMAMARAKGRFQGKQPKLSGRQQKELRRMHDSGGFRISDPAEPLSVARPTVYRPRQRQLGAV